MRNFRLKPFVATLCLAGLLSQPTFAALSETQIKQMNQRASLLEQEVRELKSEIKESKQMPRAKTRLQRSSSRAGLSDTIAARAGDLIDPAPIPESTTLATTKILELGAMPVVSSPYIGIQSRYDASHLIVNIPTFNDDYRLLKQRAQLATELFHAGLPMIKHPLIVLSGKIVAAADVTKHYSGHHSSNINLESAEFDITSQMNAWVTGLIALNFDNSAGNATTGSIASASNSRVFLSQGFITIGNLLYTPFYVTIGQRTVPFGRYSSAVISSTLPSKLGSTVARSLMVGFDPLSESGIYAAAYTFRGETRVSAVNNINRYGATFGYQYGGKWGKIFDVGVDVINQIAEANGMQATGGSGGIGSLFGAAPGFTGFGASTATESMQFRVPGIDFHAKLVLLKHFIFNAEYTGAMKAFSPLDMTFNGVGAKPRAAQLQAVYSFRIVHRPAAVGVSLNKTWQALALNVPEKNISLGANISLWRNTIQSLEILHEVNYAATTTASGAGSAVFTAGGGTNSNKIKAQMGVYF